MGGHVEERHCLLSLNCFNNYKRHNCTMWCENFGARCIILDLLRGTKLPENLQRAQLHHWNEDYLCDTKGAQV